MATSPPAVRHEILPEVWADSRRAVWFAQLGALVIADLHWGYADSHRARGNLLPAWGDDEIAARLRSLAGDYRPAETIWLGDSLHTLGGRGVAEAFLRNAGMTATVLAGNHDSRWTLATERSVQRGRYYFHHGDAAPPIPAGCVEVVGHFHPAVSLQDGAGTSLRVPGPVSSSRRLILPAFSPWAAGVPWNSRLEEGETLWAISPRRIFPLPGIA